jgi:ADP-heptose:LPS heptosyltransferase
VTWTVDGKPLGSVLVSRLRYLGDVVMSTVVLEVLHEGDPNLRLGYLCEEQHAAALTAHPLLNQLHALGNRRVGKDARARRTAPSARQVGAGAFGTIVDLRQTRYDLAVDLFFNPRSAWLLRLSGIPLRVGGTRGSRRHLYTHSVLRGEMAARFPMFDELAPGGLGEHLCRLEPLVHEETGLPFGNWFCQNYQVGQLRPRIKAQLSGPVIDEILHEAGIEPGQPFLVLAPGATWASKEWPLERWRELIGLLLVQRPDAILILTPPGSADTWGSLGKEIPPGRGGVLPVLDLPRVLGLLSRSGLLVSVDGGIMHTGVGLGIPTVGLFGPTRPDAWFPYEGSGPFRVLCTRPPCHPCDLHDCPEFICLPELPPGQVIEAISAIGQG